jgi:hypothetical protein
MTSVARVVVRRLAELVPAAAMSVRATAATAPSLRTERIMALTVSAVVAVRCARALPTRGP